MSQEIETAFVRQFHANVFHLSQQMGSRLQMCTRNEAQVGEAAFWDRIGKVTAVEITARHGDTPQIDTPHTRRMMTLIDSNYADLVDRADKIRTLLDPASEYLKSFQWALGRKRDDQIIAAALGTAYGGKTGSDSISHPNSQKFVASDGATTAGVNLSILGLRAAKKKLDANDVDDSIKRYAAVGSSQIFSLLGSTQVTSTDFNSVRALVNGELNTFLGFEFVRLERLGTTTASTTFALADGAVGSGSGTALTGARRCIFWAMDGILAAIGLNPIARITERDDKNYSTQVYVQQAFGSTRMEEEKVVEMICVES